MDKTTARMDPKTDIVPFMPYIHGIYAFNSSLFKSWIPVGNGIPSKNPNGSIITIDTAARIIKPYIKNLFRI